MISDIYRAKLIYIYLIMIVVDLLWSELSFLVSNRKKRLLVILWKGGNLFCVWLAIFGVLSFTVFGRELSNTHEMTFAASYGPEFHREMLMNAFLYFPFGLSLSTLIGPRSILVAFICSLIIEIWQYFAGTGVAQGTDVMMNTLGCVIGALPCILIRCGFIGRWNKKICGALKKGR